MQTKEINNFSSAFGFLMAAAGSAIGLGAIWKFPYIVGTNGGGAFVILFLGFSLVLGAPLLMAELYIGKRSKGTAIQSFSNLNQNKWKPIGYLGIATALLILSFYSIIGGWVLIYTFLSIFNQVVSPSVDQASMLFGDISGNLVWTILGQFVFLSINVFIINKGIQSGIEKVSKILMPLFFTFLILLVGRSLSLPGAIEGVKFFLYPDFSKITNEAILYALGQAFFSLSLGVTGMLTYGAYMKKNTSIVKSSTTVVFMNVFVSLLAGLAIFPAVFSVGADVAEGPALLFMILPTVFSQIPFGSLFLALFFLLFSFATITSSIALLQVGSAGILDTFRKTKKQVNEKKINILLTFGVGVLGIPSALSFSVFSDLKLKGMTFFDTIDFLTSNIMIPLGALLIALFTGFALKDKIISTELKHQTYRKLIWIYSLQYMIPIVLVYVLVQNALS